MSMSIGAGNFSELYDVAIATPAEFHVTSWDATAQRWVNRTPDQANLVDKSSAQTIAGAKKFASKVAIGPNDAIGGLHIQTGNAADILLYGRGAASQSGAYIDLRSSSNGAVFGVDNAGNVNVSASIFCPGIAIQGTSAALRNNYTFNWAVDSNPYSAKDVGLARQAAGQLRVTDGSTGNGRALASHFISTGSLWSLHDSSGLLMGSAQPINWSSSSAYTGGLDVGLARGAAGRLDVTNGSTGQGDMRAAGFIAGANHYVGNGSEIQLRPASATPGLRIVTSTSWSDLASTTFFQIGSANGNGTVSSLSANPFSRLNWLSNGTQFVRMGHSDSQSILPAPTRTLETGQLTASGTVGGIAILGRTSTTGRTVAAFDGEFGDSTNATYTGRVISRVMDAGSPTTGRESDRAETDGSRGYRILSLHPTAPADSMLPNNSLGMWHSASGIGMQFKWRDNGGTVRGFGLNYIGDVLSVSGIKGAIVWRDNTGNIEGYTPIYANVSQG